MGTKVIRERLETRRSQNGSLQKILLFAPRVNSITWAHRPRDELHGAQMLRPALPLPAAPGTPSGSDLARATKAYAVRH